MPISALTDHVAGAVMNLATLTGNNQLIENYLRGEVDAADFQDLIGRVYGVAGQNHRVYVQTDGLDSSAPIRYDVTAGITSGAGAAPYGTPIALDKDCELDFTIYGPQDQYNTGTVYAVKPADFISGWVWESLGNNPTAAADGTGTALTTNPHSYANWLFNAPAPTAAAAWADGTEFTGRFAKERYYDRWLTVPYGCKRIWVPEPCCLYVVAMTQGTWNHNMNMLALEHQWQADADPRKSAGPDIVYLHESKYDRSAVFRLFIDKDNDNDNRPFKWKSNGADFYANWSPIQDLVDQPRIGYGGNNDAGADQGKMLGLEWSFTCWHRATARVASRIYVPEAGYYNISLRYNSRYFHGFVDPDIGGGIGTWVNSSFARTENEISIDDNDVAERPGPINIARWEKTSIGAVAHFVPGVAAANAFTDDVDDGTQA